MKSDELIGIWKEYGTKLQGTIAIQDKLILSMICERSTRRFEAIKRKYAIGITWMLFCLLVAIVILFTNPFDYRHSLQYIPIGIFAGCLAILTSRLVVSYAGFKKISINHRNVNDALKNIIGIYEKPHQFFRYTIIVFLFTQVVLFPLSFLPVKIDRVGLSSAIVDTLIPIGISALLLFIAFKAGAFKDKDGASFLSDLDELNELKAHRRELENEG